MKRASLVLFALVLLACKEEKPIVIKFEPNDLSARPTALATSDAGAVASPSPSASPYPSLSPSPSPSAKTHAKGEDPECKSAADCALVPADCCDCANGGAQTAIARAQLAAHEATRKKKCASTLCTQVFSTDPTCGKRPDCVDGRCGMRDKKPGEK